MERILLTGFEPFSGSSMNPSQEVIKKIVHPSLIAKEVLPVTFSGAAKRSIELIDYHSPNVVLALGQAGGISNITAEQVAINLVDARIPDNEGNAPQDRAIVPGGPNAYLTTLPINKIVDRLNDSAIPASISLDAGTFVCNYIFYSIQHHCTGKGIKSGFIHLPLMQDQSSEFPGLPTMSLDEMVRGITLVIDLLNETN